MLEKIERLRKLQIELGELEEDIINDALDNLGIKDELLDLASTVLEDAEYFDSSTQILSVLEAMTTKKASVSSKNSKGKKNREKNREKPEE